MTEIVTLRTGKEVPEPVVGTTMLALGRILADNPIALYELVQICRDPAHDSWPGTAAALEAIGLMHGGAVHEVTRDIVLAAVAGDDLHPYLQSPLAPQGD